MISLFYNPRYDAHHLLGWGKELFWLDARHFWKSLSFRAAIPDEYSFYTKQVKDKWMSWHHRLIAMTKLSQTYYNPHSLVRPQAVHYWCKWSFQMLQKDSCTVSLNKMRTQSKEKIPKQVGTCNALVECLTEIALHHMSFALMYYELRRHLWTIQDTIWNINIGNDTETWWCLDYVES